MLTDEQILNALMTLREEQRKPRPNEAIVAACEIVLSHNPPRFKRPSFVELSQPKDD